MLDSTNRISKIQRSLSLRNCHFSSLNQKINTVFNSEALKCQKPLAVTKILHNIAEKLRILLQIAL